MQLAIFMCVCISLTAANYTIITQTMYLKPPIRLKPIPIEENTDQNNTAAQTSNNIERCKDAEHKQNMFSNNFAKYCEENTRLMRLLLEYCSDVAATTTELPATTTELPATTTASITCTKDYVVVGNICYKFISHKSVTWYEALRECEGLGATLAHPVDDEQNTLLNEYLHEKYVDRLWWLGATSDNSTVGWRWAHSEEPVEDIRWDETAESAGGNCAYLRSSLTYNWFNSNCNLTKAFICQQ